MYCNLLKGSNKFRKIILSQGVPHYGAPCPQKVRRKRYLVFPGWERQRGTRARATRYEWKKVPNGIVELRLWWYWREFRGKSGHRLAASRCHSCENPKTRRYCSEQRISSLAHTLARMRVDVSNFIIRTFWLERSDDHEVRSEENNFSCFFSRDTWHMWRLFLTIWHEKGCPGD